MAQGREIFIKQFPKQIVVISLASYFGCRAETIASSTSGERWRTTERSAFQRRERAIIDQRNIENGRAKDTFDHLQ